MPVKWDPGNNQTLLVQIIDTTPGLKLDLTRIAETWPVVPGQERPTPRAIREQISKIRSTTKARISTAIESIETGQERKKRQPSSTNGVSHPNVRAVPMDPIPAGKKRMGTKLVKTEGEDDVTMIKDEDDADDETDVEPITPPSDRKTANRVSPKTRTPHALGLGTPAGPHTPQSVRKKSTTPASRKSIRHHVDAETDSDETTLSGIMGRDGIKMETRNKRVKVYQSDDSQPESQISEFGMEED